jgi:ABC-2 type transport system ATP-binding protein
MIREFFRNYNRETGATILLTSHYLEDIKSLCERIIFINHGRILFDGAIEEIVERYAPDVHISFSTEGATSREGWDELSSLGEVSFDEADRVFRLRVVRARSTEAARRILTTRSVTSILIEEPSMEEVVTALGGENAH